MLRTKARFAFQKPINSFKMHTRRKREGEENKTALKSLSLSGCDTEFSKKVQLFQSKNVGILATQFLPQALGSLSHKLWRESWCVFPLEDRWWCRRAPGRISDCLLPAGCRLAAVGGEKAMAASLKLNTPSNPGSTASLSRQFHCLWSSHRVAGREATGQSHEPASTPMQSCANKIPMNHTREKTMAL